MPLVKLAGIPLEGLQTIPWELSPGTVPFQTTVELKTRTAETIYDRATGSSTELEIGKETYRNVWVIGLTSGSTPHTRTLELSDGRIWWQRTITARAYNVRQRTGDIQIVGKVRREIAQYTPDVAYHEYSLKNGQAWKIDEAIRDLFDDPKISDRVDVPTIRRRIPLENIDDELPFAGMLELVLRQAAGYQVRPTKEAERYEVYDLHDDTEGAELAKLQVIEDFSGYYAEADRKGTRPRYVEVLWTPECELRFNFDEQSQDQSTPRNREPRLMENVVRVPDAEINIPALSRKVAAGTIVRLDHYLEACRALTQSRNSAYSLTLDRIRRWRNHPSRLYEFFATTTGGYPDGDWRARIDAILASWRTTYRILKPWRDRIRAYRAYRVGIVSPANRTRSKAQAWQQHVEFPEARFANVFRKSAHRTEYGWGGDDYAANLKGRNESPVDVVIEDSETGVIGLHLRSGHLRDTENMLPGRPVKFPRFTDGRGIRRYLNQREVEFRADFKAAVIFTAVKAAPNNTGRLYAYKVTPQTAQQRLRFSVGEAKGPPLQIVVPYSPTTSAQFIWDDDSAAEIDEAWFTGKPLPEKLLSNRNTVKEVSEAIAAQVYAVFRDRNEGDFVATYSPDLLPTGSISSVSHQVDSDGVITTSVSLPRLEAPFDFWALVDSQIRQQVRGTVIP